MSRKDLTIGLFGFGCAGYGLYQVLEKTPGLKASIKRICVKDRSKQRPIAAERFTFDKDELLDDPSINVIVELIDDSASAFGIVKAALSKGKAVVTANKKMIAEHFSELLELQGYYKVPVLYEAACCASIPIIRSLEEYYDNDLLESVEGIVNGSTNYILTKTAEGASYSNALIDAQQKGYAESNPILDTGGYDSKYKLLILIAHAFGLVVKPDDIFNIGIDRLDGLELNYAREKHLKIKLVAHASKDDKGHVRAFVLPQFVEPADKLFSVDDVFNGIKTKSVFSDSQFFCGKGAGAYPTASAVISDVSALSYNYRYEYKKLGNPGSLIDDDNLKLRVFLSHKEGASILYQDYFEHIEEVYYNLSSGYIIGALSLSKLKLLSGIYEDKISVVLFPSGIIENQNENIILNEYAIA